MMTSSNEIQQKFIRSTAYIVIGILLLIFLLVQPYNIFCRIKTTCQPITLSSLPFHKNGKREMTFSFISNIPDDLKQAVEFYPQKADMKVLNGKNIINSYLVKNLTTENIVVAAHFDIKPEGIEKYLERIECICFQNQSLSGGKNAAMPLNFRIDPRIENDAAFRDVKEIAVSYSVYLAE